MKKNKRDSIWSVPFVFLMSVNLFQSLASFMTNTTLPLYASFLGASTGIVGVVVGSFAIAALLIRPFAGPAFDSFSRKWMLVVCLACIGAAMFLYSVIDNLAVFVAVRLLHGIGVGCAGPLTISLVSEFLPPTKFSSGISIFSLAQSFGQVVGPALGLFFVENIGFYVTYRASSVCLLASILMVVLIKEPERERLPYELKLNRMFAKTVVSKAFALMLLAMAYSCSNAYVVLYGYSMGVYGLGVYFAVYAGCMLLTRPMFGSLADKFGAPRLILVGMIFFAMSYITLSFSRNFVTFICAALLGSAGYGVCFPLLQSLALESVSDKYRGAAGNTIFSGLDLGMLIGPIVGGYTVEILTGLRGSEMLAYSNMWLVMLIPIAGAFVLALVWNKKIDKEKKLAASEAPTTPQSQDES